MRRLLLSLLLVMMIFSLAVGGCAKEEPEVEPILIGHLTILSGPLTWAGESAAIAVDQAVDEINERGGVLGRPLKVIRRDSASSVEKAVKWMNDLITVDKVDVIIEMESTAVAISLKECARDLKFTHFTACETTSVTADPATFDFYTIRCGRQGVFDIAVGGAYIAKVARENGWTKFFGLNPDYAYGREQWELFKEALTYYMPEAEFVGETWPKIFEPDMTPNIGAILAAEPDAVLTSLWAGDAITFINQATPYNLFDKIAVFGTCISENMIIDLVTEWPEGIHGVVRCLRDVPDTDLNREYFDACYDRSGRKPLNWANGNYVAVLFFEAAANKAGTLEPDALIKAAEGLTINAAWGSAPDGELTIRAEDHTVIGYAVEWGRIIAEEPYLVDRFTLTWDEIIEFEQMMLKKWGYIK